MPCQPFTLPDGTSGIVCSRSKVRRQRCACGAPADRLCDWKTPSGQTPTCDAPLCAACSTQPEPEKDLCPDHARQWRAWQTRQQTRQGAA
jgi:hypothetical protein